MDMLKKEVAYAAESNTICIPAGDSLSLSLASFLNRAMVVQFPVLSISVFLLGRPSMPSTFVVWHPPVFHPSFQLYKLGYAYMSRDIYG